MQQKVVHCGEHSKPDELLKIGIIFSVCSPKSALWIWNLTKSALGRFRFWVWRAKNKRNVKSCCKNVIIRKQNELLHQLGNTYLHTYEIFPSPWIIPTYALFRFSFAIALWHQPVLINPITGGDFGLPRLVGRGDSVPPLRSRKLRNRFRRNSRHSIRCSLNYTLDMENFKKIQNFACKGGKTSNFELF